MLDRLRRRRRASLVLSGIAPASPQNARPARSGGALIPADCVHSSAFETDRKRSKTTGNIRSTRSRSQGTAIPL